MSDANLIVSILKDVRHRLFFVLYFNSFSIAVCGLVFIMSSLVFLGVPFKWPPAVMASLSFSAAISAAALAALWRMPSWKETAKIVDRRLGLEQRLETAFECLKPRAEIDELVLCDAAHRLRHAHPATAVPLRLAGATKVIFGAVLIACSGLAIMRLLITGNKLPFSTSDNAEQVSGLVPGQPEKKETPSQKRNSPARSAALRSSPGISNMQPDSGRATKRGNFAPAPAGNMTPSQANAAGAPPFPQSGSGKETLESAKDFFGALAANSTAPAPSRLGRPDQPAGTSTSRDAQATTLAGDSASNSARRLSTNAGNAAEREVRAHAGGQPTGLFSSPGGLGDASGAAAARGTATPSGRGVLSKRDEALLARYSGDYQASWLAAEKALAKETIPPGFRKYIAAYFAAIHP